MQLLTPLPTRLQTCERSPHLVHCKEQLLAFIASLNCPPLSPSSRCMYQQCSPLSRIMPHMAIIQNSAMLQLKQPNLQFT